MAVAGAIEALASPEASCARAKVTRTCGTGIAFFALFGSFTKTRDNASSMADAQEIR